MRTELDALIGRLKAGPEPWKWPLMDELKRRLWGLGINDWTRIAEVERLVYEAATEEAARRAWGQYVGQFTTQDTISAKPNLPWIPATEVNRLNDLRMPVAEELLDRMRIANGKDRADLRVELLKHIDAHILQAEMARSTHMLNEKTLRDQAERSFWPVADNYHRAGTVKPALLDPETMIVDKNDVGGVSTDEVRSYAR